MNAFHSFKSKIDARLEARRNGESGLALLDVLLGMAIFALIAVIAVQAMGTFRERGYVTQATSDVKQAATGIEGAMTAPGATFDYVAGPITVDGVNLTNGNTLHLVSGDETNYVICVANTSTEVEAYYGAAGGSVTDAGKGDGDCSTPLL